MAVLEELDEEPVPVDPVEMEVTLPEMSTRVSCKARKVLLMAAADKLPSKQSESVGAPLSWTSCRRLAVTGMACHPHLHSKGIHSSSCPPRCSK